MLDFFVNNWGTLLAGVIVLAVVILVIVKLIRDKKKGKKACGCDCGHCAASAGCHRGTTSGAQSKIKMAFILEISHH